MWNRNRSILPVKRPRATTPSPSRSPSPEEDDVPLRELVREKAAAQNGPQRESLAEKPAAAVERAVPRSAEKPIVRGERGFELVLVARGGQERTC